MSTKPRTIDNLGIDASSRYAYDQEIYDAKFIQESSVVSSKSEISVLKPYLPSDFEQIFGAKRTISWALFSSPPHLFSYGRSLFSYQLIPSLKKMEEEDLEEMVEDALQKRKRPSDQENEEEKKEKQLIVNLLQCIKVMDETLSIINSRRNQYQKG